MFLGAYTDTRTRFVPIFKYHHENYREEMADAILPFLGGILR
jgi:hypothetical protein